MGASVSGAAPSSGGFLGAVLDCFNVLHDPAGVFGRVKERPRILAPWLVLAACLIVVTIITRPFQQAAFEAFRATLSPEQAERMAGGGGGGVGGLILLPLIVFVGLAAGAGLLWIGVSLSGAQGRYKTLLSTLAYSYVTYVLFSAVATTVLMVRGSQAITGFEDLRAPLGLDLLVPGAGLFLGTVLNGINPFSIWGVWLCGTGVSVTHGTSRSSGIVVTAVAFLIGLLLQSAPTLLLGMMTRQ